MAQNCRIKETVTIEGRKSQIFLLTPFPSPSSRNLSISVDSILAYVIRIVRYSPELDVFSSLQLAAEMSMGYGEKAKRLEGSGWRQLGQGRERGARIELTFLISSNSNSKSESKSSRGGERTSSFVLKHKRTYLSLDPFLFPLRLRRVGLWQRP